MDIRKVLKEISWIRPWRSVRESGVSEAVQALLRECAAPAPDLVADLQDVIARSRDFPIAFPIDTVRLETLKQRCPVKRLVSNVESTYPIMHERVVVLIAQFLLYKREHGSKVEQELYKNMTIIDFIDRLMLKRAATFMKAQDQYKLLNGQSGKDGWEDVGSDREKAPLVLKDCLSYDEMKISALVYVSGHTECLNDGSRKNQGVVRTDDVEPNAVIIGIVGARFKRPNRMEYEDILVTPDQNTPKNGFGKSADDMAHPATRAYRLLWENFYQIPSVTFPELTREVKLSGCTGRRVFSARWAGVKQCGFDNESFHRRLVLTADVVLLEADARAAGARATAFLNVIGAGLGIWKHSIHQIDVYVLTFLERITSLLDAGLLPCVADVNFAYIQPKKEVLELFGSKKTGTTGEEVRSLFIKNDAHPRGGINVQLESREPSTKLCGEHEGKLLVLTYAWDSNALPGNEFWMGKLSSSGDSAAACATQVSELHNAHVNRHVRGACARVAARAVHTLQDCCTDLAGDNATRH